MGNCLRGLVLAAIAVNLLAGCGSSSPAAAAPTAAAPTAVVGIATPKAVSVVTAN